MRRLVCWLIGHLYNPAIDVEREAIWQECKTCRKRLWNVTPREADSLGLNNKRQAWRQRLSL